MANELQYRCGPGGSGQTLYAVLQNADGASADHGKLWKGASGWEAMTVANWGDYDIPLVESPASSHLFTNAGDIPGSLGACTVRVLIFLQAEASPAVSDDLLADQVFVWTGTEMLTAEKVMELVDAVQAGDMAFVEATGAATFKRRDGSTEAATYTVSSTSVGRSGAEVC